MAKKKAKAKSTAPAPVERPKIVDFAIAQHKAEEKKTQAELDVVEPIEASNTPEMTIRKNYADIKKSKAVAVVWIDDAGENYVVRWSEPMTLMQLSFLRQALDVQLMKRML